ncbi:MAG: pitrilysin family protein [Gemmatimonadota bacterium]|nr:pitrilysin family protein [Gemmatimonadota bacterium]MDQ8166700.1 pitrilysin family protein [Gemmatimonadota bacterium]MDQ8171426.1 pitrilysin family protein [Gemmatimonadota bacterium]
MTDSLSTVAMTETPPAPPRPVAGTPSDYRFPHFATRILANGLRVIVASVPAYPVVTTLAVVEAGATRDPRDYEGLAQLTTRALAEGTRDMNALELTSRLEMLGTTLDTGADWDSAIVQITALSSRIDDAVAVLSEVLRHPAFPESELERMRGERLADLAQLRAEPRGLSDVFFSRLLYQKASRFARLAGGDEASIMRLTRERVEAYHAEFYRPDATALMIVGDIDVERAVKLASTHFGDWTGNAPPVTEPLDAQRYAEPRVHLVHKPDASQSEVRVGHVAIPRLHEDYFPVVVMNAILGGLFSSRLNLNLREVHAYTYGAHSAFDWRRAASPFEISTAVETVVTADALREIALEFTRIREAPVSEAELSLATSYLVGVFPIRFETTAEVAGGLANVEIFRLPTNYFDTYRDRVKAVTAQDVLRVAQTHLDPSRLQVVVVGDASAIRASVEALHLGPVIVYDPADDDVAVVPVSSSSSS